MAIRDESREEGKNKKQIGERWNSKSVKWGIIQKNSL